MKKLITEKEEKEIKKLHDLNESWFDDIVGELKDNPFIKQLMSAFGGKQTQTSKNTPSSGIGDYKLTEPNSDDKKFYEDILEGIGAKVTDENLLFFYAWRQAEGAKATYNPFNTTQKKEGSTFWNCLKKKDGKCVAGVRNYKSETDGIDATVKTLTNGHYSCIIDGLKNNIGAKEIAECADLKTWGTGGLIKKILDKKGINPPAISRSLVKKV